MISPGSARSVFFLGISESGRWAFHAGSDLANLQAPISGANEGSRTAKTRTRFEKREKE